jgi:hypothetical protein
MISKKGAWICAGLLAAALAAYVSRLTLFSPHTTEADSYASLAQAVPSPALQSPMKQLADLRTALHGAANADETRQARAALRQWFAEHPVPPQPEEGTKK